MRHVLVTGGTGFIGQALVAALVRRGDIVTVLSRAGSGNGAPASAAIITEFPAPKDWCFDVVINLAGENLFESRWSETTKQRFVSSRVGTTVNLVDALAQQNRTTLLISGSAIGYYGASNDQCLTEEAPAGTDFPAMLCSQWEQEALQAEALGITTALLRTGVVLHRSGGALKRMLLPFKLGLGGRVGSGEQWFSWVTRDDLVRLILFIVDQHFDGETVAGAWNGTSPHPVRNSRFTKELGSALNRPTPLPVPAKLLKLAMGESAEMLLSGQRVIPQRAVDVGFQYKDWAIGTALRRML